VAESLARAGLRVLVIDRGEPACGSTAASTALLQYEIDVPLIDLRKKLGQERADHSYRIANEALNAFGLFHDCLPGKTELRPTRSIQVAAAREELPRLEAEAEARAGLGVPVRVVGADELAALGLRRPAGLLSPGGYTANPVALTLALLRSAEAHGARVLPRMPIEFERKHRTVRACCPQADIRLDADWTIVATGYRAPDPFDAVRLRTRYRSTYAAAVTLGRQQGWGHDRMLWETGHPYFYGRATPDGGLLIGGEDEDYLGPSRRDALIGTKTKALLSHLEDLAPGLAAVPVRSWAGTFAETDDGLPFVGRHAQWRNILFALCYGGNGMTFSVVAADIIRRIVCHGECELEPLFSFTRS
jgi:glycine/D-amino acid oxidase-like deaminating enzyme